MSENPARASWLPLRGHAIRHATKRPALTHAARLLGLLGADVEVDESLDGLDWDGLQVGPGGAPECEEADWARSGVMALTGSPEGPPLVAPGAPATAARGASLAIEALTAAAPWARRVTLDGAQLLGERAAFAGLARRGPISPGGSCRLVDAIDGVVAVNLPRPEDRALVPAWLESSVGADLWETVRNAASRRSAHELAERGQLLGIPVASVPQPRQIERDEQSRARGKRFPPDPWCIGPTSCPSSSSPGLPAVGAAPAPPGRPDREGSASRDPAPGLVVDLSSMWAGPLCAHLLGLAGLAVVKVESISRPDGARGGPEGFYDLLHAGHRSVALDFASELDRSLLARLIESADVVIESSRPRALDHLGLGPELSLGLSPGLVWVSITAYGRTGPWCNRVGFGDDTAASAGLVVSGPDGRPMLCGDAIADPIAGLDAALAALGMLCSGSGGLVDVAMRDAVAWTLAGQPVRPPTAAGARRLDGSWSLDTAFGSVPVMGPRARTPAGHAAPMGVDNGVVLAGLTR